MTESRELAEKLRTEGERLVNFFGGLTDEQWRTEIYTEGSLWTVRNVLSHIFTSERAFVKLFSGIREGGTGVSDDFSIDRYNARQQEKTQDLSPRELFENYKAVRAEMIAFVSTLGDEELELTGRHPYLGMTTLREMIKMVYVHNQIHYRDIKRVLK